MISWGFCSKVLLLAQGRGRHLRETWACHWAAGNWRADYPCHDNGCTCTLSLFVDNFRAFLRPTLSDSAQNSTHNQSHQNSTVLNCQRMLSVNMQSQRKVQRRRQVGEVPDGLLVHCSTDVSKV
eukprot:TRINITY_DN67486_c0_g1_i1.p1 TRINITY_DN67486_c0_g1~~TRINITY_DN67486_c0_g1_i1.p1  ORF type:complete len:124 (+),score=0.06 TRINITY_DN67486_c0_g1_i1:1033-1404(+)